MNKESAANSKLVESQRVSYMLCTGFENVWRELLNFSTVTVREQLLGSQFLENYQSITTTVQTRGSAIFQLLLTIGR